jgi:hypothetical protein
LAQDFEDNWDQTQQHDSNRNEVDVFFDEWNASQEVSSKRH